MVAIGRALMLDPDLLIMDEPSLGLSPLYVKQVMHAIRQVADIGFPVLLVEQNIKQVLQFSHRTYVLENGRLVLQGPSSELEGHRGSRKAYRGRYVRGPPRPVRGAGPRSMDRSRQFGETEVSAFPLDPFSREGRDGFARDFRAGKVTSEEVTKIYLQRIERL